MPLAASSNSRTDHHRRVLSRSEPHNIIYPLIGNEIPSLISIHFDPITSQKEKGDFVLLWIGSVAAVFSKPVIDASCLSHHPARLKRHVDKLSATCRARIKPATGLALGET